MEEHCLLAAHWLMLTYHSHIAQTHLARDGIAHIGRGPSTSTNNQDMAIGLSEPANASSKTPCQVTLHCVSLAVTTNQYSFRSALLLGAWLILSWVANIQRLLEHLLGPGDKKKCLTKSLS